MYTYKLPTLPTIPEYAITNDMKQAINSVNGDECNICKLFASVMYDCLSL